MLRQLRYMPYSCMTCNNWQVWSLKQQDYLWKIFCNWQTGNKNCIFNFRSPFKYHLNLLVELIGPRIISTFSSSSNFTISQTPCLAVEADLHVTLRNTIEQNQEIKTLVDTKGNNQRADVLYFVTPPARPSVSFKCTVNILVFKAELNYFK